MARRGRHRLPPRAGLKRRLAAVAGTGCRRNARRCSRGAFYSTIVAREDGGETTLFLLPPRCCEHEADLAHAYEIREVIDVGLRRAWAWLKETLGFKSTRAAPPAGI